MHPAAFMPGNEFVCLSRNTGVSPGAACCIAIFRRMYHHEMQI